jgi:putative intracellular protease/amidase
VTQETVHVAIYDTMADWEVGYAIAHIRSPEFQKMPCRYQVKTVGRSLDPVTSKGGMRLLPDLRLDALEPEASRMLILPGADIAMTGGIDDFAAMAGRFLASGVPVAAICGATAALARQGLLDRRSHTSNAKAFLEMTGYRGGAYYQDRLAITVGDLITASGIAPVSFAAEIFRKLDLYGEATLTSWLKLYQDQDPAGFYELIAESAP